MQLLEKLRTRQSETKSTALGTYRELCIDVADEADLMPEDVEDRLEAVGKTVLDLEADVAWLCDRRKLVDDIEEREFANARRLEFEKECDKLMAKRKKLLTTIDGQIGEVREKINECNAVVNQRVNVERHLRESAPGWIESELKSLRQEQAEAEKKRSYASSEIQFNVAKTEAAEENLKGVVERLMKHINILGREGELTATRDNTRDEIAGRRVTIKNAKVSFDEASKRLGEIDARIRSLEAAWLTEWPERSIG